MSTAALIRISIDSVRPSLHSGFRFFFLFNGLRRKNDDEAMLFFFPRSVSSKNRCEKRYHTYAATKKRDTPREREKEKEKERGLEK